MKILIVGPSWVGDSVISQSLFKLIKTKPENPEIHVLAPQWTVNIYERMKEVSKTSILPFNHGDFKIKERFELGRSLRNESYDQAIILPNSLKSSLVPFFAGIPMRTGWSGEVRYFLINDIRKLNKTSHPRMVDRFVSLAFKKGEGIQSNIPYPSLTIDKKNLDLLSSTHGFELDKSTICFCPGAEFGPSKRWPSDYYAEVVNEFILRDWQIMLLGSPNDIPIGEEIKKELQQNQNFFNLIGKTRLVDAIDILSMAKLVLSNDSGLMHIAAALEVNLVALFGPSSPEFTPPLSKKSVIIRKNEGYSKVRKGIGRSGYHQSLLDIKTSEVIESLEEIGSN